MPWVNYGARLVNPAAGFLFDDGAVMRGEPAAQPGQASVPAQQTYSARPGLLRMPKPAPKAVVVSPGAAGRAEPGTTDVAVPGPTIYNGPHRWDYGQSAEGNIAKLASQPKTLEQWAAFFYPGPTSALPHTPEHERAVQQSRLALGAAAEAYNDQLGRQSQERIAQAGREAGLEQARINAESSQEVERLRQQGERPKIADALILSGKTADEIRGAMKARDLLSQDRGGQQQTAGSRDPLQDALDLMRVPPKEELDALMKAMGGKLPMIAGAMAKNEQLQRGAGGLIDRLLSSGQYTLGELMDAAERQLLQGSLRGGIGPVGPGTGPLNVGGIRMQVTPLPRGGHRYSLGVPGGYRREWTQGGGLFAETPYSPVWPGQPGYQRDQRAEAEAAAALLREAYSRAARR